MTPPKPVRILYVDDDVTEHAALRTRLAGIAHDVIGFASGAALYAHLDTLTTPPHVVVLVDLVLGAREDGYHVIQHLTRHYGRLLRQSPIIAVTGGRASKASVDGADAVGAAAYVRKPITLEDLVTVCVRSGWYRVELVSV